jgi:hypothetical protein
MTASLRLASGNSSASHATAATNSTHTPMNVVVRNTSSMGSEVANPAPSAEKAYTKMLHVSIRRRPSLSVR